MEQLEDYVQQTDPAAIRARLSGATTEDRKNLELAIMTHIACGDSSIEKAFPEFAHANPANHDWSKQK